MMMIMMVVIYIDIVVCEYDFLLIDICVGHAKQFTG